MNVLRGVPRVSRNFMSNIAEMDSSIKEVKDVMIESGLEKISVEMPLKFDITLGELDDYLSDPENTLETIIYDKNWGEEIVYEDIRVKETE